MIYIYLFILIILWTLNPLIKKKIINRISSEDYFFVNHLVVSVFVIIYFLYKKVLNKHNSRKNSNMLVNLNKKDKMYLIIGGLLTVLGSRLLPYIISMDYDVSDIISNVQPIVIILTALLGFMFFGEKLNKKKIIGILIICLGLLIINM